MTLNWIPMVAIYLRYLVQDLVLCICLTLVRNDDTSTFKVNDLDNEV